MSTDIGTYDLQLLVNFKHFLAKTYLTNTDEIWALIDHILTQWFFVSGFCKFRN